jgi:hypothetical protein
MNITAIKEKYNQYKVAINSAIAGVGVTVASMGHAFAQTPAYTMDSTVQTSVTDLLESLVATVFSVLPIAIGIVGALVVTLFGVRWLIGFARSNMHG